MPIYTEVQHNKVRWFFVAFYIASYILLVVWLINGEHLSGYNSYSWVGIYVFAGLFHLILLSLRLFIRLDTKIDNVGVHIRTPYTFSKWQFIAWAEIDRIYVREYALFGEYPKGILGLRQGPGGFAFAPQYGVFGLQIEKASGGKYLLGTQRPDELKQFLMNRSVSNPVSPA